MGGAAAAVCLAVASTPNHILKRQLRDAVRLLGGLVTASGSKAPTARAGTLLAPTAAAAQAAELRSRASHALSRAMSGEHGYDYDLVVMEGLEFQRNFTHEVPKLAGRPPIVSLTSRCFTIGLATA